MADLIDATKVAGEWPEHDKLAAISDKSQIIGEFLEWLELQGIVFAKWGTVESHSDQLFGVHLDINSVLATFFGIDLAKLEQEKRAMIARINLDAQRPWLGADLGYGDN